MDLRSTNFASFPTRLAGWYIFIASMYSYSPWYVSIFALASESTAYLVSSFDTL